MADTKKLGYSLQEKRSRGVSTIEEVSSTRRNRSKITVSLKKQRSLYKPPLFYKYDISKYDLHENYFLIGNNIKFQINPVISTDSLGLCLNFSY